MCGIIGYNGKDKTISVLINGLKALEYRGYDSAGVAYNIGDKTVIKKAKGKIANLENSLDMDTCSDMGIGHTRWATHGEPSSLNSHPHNVSDITIVHNGIIENYMELKNWLMDNGYNFKSSTDTEVACAMIDYYYKKRGDIKLALCDFMNSVKGAYALGIMVKGNSNIYSIRKDCPLVLGKGFDCNFIASDVIAFDKSVDKIYYLEPGQIAEVSSDDIKIFDDMLCEVSADFIDIPNISDDISKCGYEHYMLKEIHEQPKVFKNTTFPYVDDGVNTLINKMPDLTKYNRIDIVACGSAYHTGLVGKSLIEDFADVQVNVCIASEYRYKKNFYNEDTLVILVSQSGETADTLACLRKAKDDGVDTLGIINVGSSSIAREADILLKVEAGVEIAVATTKAYSAQVAMLGLIALNLASRKNLIDKGEIKEILTEIKELPVKIESTINNCDYKSIANSIYDRDDVFFIGRGVDYALSMEGSLKLKEISYIPSQAYAAGELKHGTISLINDGTPVVGIITDCNLKDKTISNIEEVKSRGAKVVIVTNDDTINGYDHIIKVPKVHKLLQPLLTILPLQLISYEVARLRNCDIDKPKNLAKSVTVE